MTEHPHTVETQVVGELDRLEAAARIAREDAEREAAKPAHRRAKREPDPPAKAPENAETEEDTTS